MNHTTVRPGKNSELILVAPKFEVEPELCDPLIVWRMFSDCLAPDVHQNRQQTAVDNIFVKFPSRENVHCVVQALLHFTPQLTSQCVRETPRKRNQWEVGTRSTTLFQEGSSRARTTTPNTVSVSDFAVWDDLIVLVTAFPWSHTTQFLVP